MKNFRVGENRGITLVVLVITIVVMLIITTTVISLSTNNLKTKHLSNMYTDIKSLDDKVAVFYNQYGTLPLKEKFTGSMQFQTVANPNDDLDGYYVIDVNKLNNLVLTKKLTWQNEDVYIINTKTHTIYYPHGVTLDGETYYRLPGEYSVIKEPENIEGEIAIAINPSTPTNKDVTATITWPSGNYSATKEVSTNGGTTYTTVTGTTTQITIKANCNIRARIKTASGEIKTKTYEITNIDKTNPTVTAKQSSVTITEGDSNELSNYFTITANGKYGIASTVYTDASNNNAVVTNTNTLVPGTHVIKCTATKETGATANATITIVVEERGPKVDENGLAKENTTIKPDENSNLQIVIPTGFAPAILQTGKTQSLPGQDGRVKNKMPASQWNNITAEDINKGIVVVDADGNEFVWIPITDASKFARSAFGKTLAATSTENAYWEDTTTTEYTNMVNSITSNKGFYVARYEASANSDSSKAQSKRGATAWTYISQTDAITKAANYNSTLHSHLIYGIEWDSILNWLKGNATISSSTSGQTKTMELADLQTNSSSWGNYSGSTGNAATNSGSEQTTGKSEYWKANNIYDLAGNVLEWTQEKWSTGTGRADRGGIYYYSGDYYPVADRGYNAASYTHLYIGFRASFYL